MAQSLWSQLQQELQDQLDPEEFLTWFRPLKVASENPRQLVLEDTPARLVPESGRALTRLSRNL